MDVHVSLVRKTYDEVINKFAEITDQLVVNVIKILETPIGVLRKNLLCGFVNLIDLELNNCAIFMLKNDVFEDLINLVTINLSDNVITSINNNLFESNLKLKTIIFKNNLLHSINGATFCRLDDIQTLDFSYNHISELGDELLKCQNLNELRLNNNFITNITYGALENCPNLTHLVLDNNVIDNIECNIFEKLRNLKYLNLNCNRISQIYPCSFYRLTELNTLYLKNNRLSHKICGTIFSQNSKLLDLDLSENDIPIVAKYTFDDCPNLTSLNLKVRGHFEICSIRNSKSLTRFQLHYSPYKKFAFTSGFWGFLKNKFQLTVLVLIFKEVCDVRLCDFSCLPNLEHLHIEFLKPNKCVRDINFVLCFDHMSNLKTLILKKLNCFTISKTNIVTRNLIHIDLTGVQNTLIDCIFHTFTRLQYLNLSFSGVTYLISAAFEILVHLEHVNLEFSKISSINKSLFRNNCELRILNFANCCIDVIEDGSFSNLHKLQSLDLRNNFLANITEFTFSGLNRETCNILLNL